jgi:tRNA(fMet)-specific endonuclease VapC
MRVALDTNAYSDFMRGVESRVRVVQAAARVYLPLFVLGELRAGFAAGAQASRNAAVLGQFLASRRVELLLPDAETAEHYARLFAHLRGQGTPIPTNDLWIAALVVQHGLMLCTSDAHFRHLPQLSVC